jgi:hypothetical protein
LAAAADKEEDVLVNVLAAGVADEAGFVAAAGAGAGAGAGAFESNEFEIPPDAACAGAV